MLLQKWYAPVGNPQAIRAKLHRDDRVYYETLTIASVICQPSRNDFNVSIDSLLSLGLSCLYQDLLCFYRSGLKLKKRLWTSFNYIALVNVLALLLLYLYMTSEHSINFSVKALKHGTSRELSSPRNKDKSERFVRLFIIPQPECYNSKQHSKLIWSYYVGIAIFELMYFVT